MTRFFLPLLGGLALVFISACDKQETVKKDQPLRVNAAIAAVVNGEYILSSEVEIEAAAQGRMEPGSKLDITDPNFDDVLQQLIDQKLLAQEALARGLDQDESARHRLHAARERILGNILVENLVSEEVDETAILEMYQAQTELQQLGEEVLIRHILVNTKEEADELYDRLKGGAEFAELAFQNSIDRETNAEGGLIAYVLPEAMGEPFASVINRTAVGAISRPFESELGWHILKVDDRRAEEPPTLDETRPKIVQFLTLSEISKVLKRLRTRSEIQTITEGDPMTAFESADFSEDDEAYLDDEEMLDEEMSGESSDEPAAEETEAASGSDSGLKVIQEESPQ